MTGRRARHMGGLAVLAVTVGAFTLLGLAAAAVAYL